MTYIDVTSFEVYIRPRCVCLEKQNLLFWTKQIANTRLIVLQVYLYATLKTIVVVPSRERVKWLVLLKIDLIFLQQRVLKRKFPWNWLTNTWQFSLIFQPFQIIFIHYESRIATAIRGL